MRSASESFGENPKLIYPKRHTDNPVGIDWYIAHIAGCFVSYAAHLGVPDYIKSIQCLQSDLLQVYKRQGWLNLYNKKRISLGFPAEEPEGGKAIEEPPF